MLSLPTLRRKRLQQIRHLQPQKLLRFYESHVQHVKVGSNGRCQPKASTLYVAHCQPILPLGSCPKLYMHKDYLEDSNKITTFISA